MMEFRTLGLEKSAENIAKKKQNAGSKKIEQHFGKAKGKSAGQPSQVARKKRVDSSGIEMLCYCWKSEGQAVDDIGNRRAQQNRS